MRKIFKNLVFNYRLITAINKGFLETFIIQGNALKVNFTEKEFIQYKERVFSWLSYSFEKSGEYDLARTYFSKMVDTIYTDGNLVQLEIDADYKERLTFRRGQLDSILSLLNDFRVHRELYWKNVRSWLAITISVFAFISSII